MVYPILADALLNPKFVMLRMIAWEFFTEIEFLADTSKKFGSILKNVDPNVLEISHHYRNLSESDYGGVVPPHSNLFESGDISISSGGSTSDIIRLAQTTLHPSK